MKVDPSDTYQIIILLILLALSAFFSSNETALMSVNKIRLRSLADEGNKRAAMALDILENQTPKLLSAILIGNNIVNLWHLPFQHPLPSIFLETRVRELPQVFLHF